MLLARAPEARVVDLVHAAEPDCLHATAYLLTSVFSYFPPGTVHLILADPGAAPDRRVLAAETDGQYVVTPDNGVAASLFAEHPPAATVVVQNPRFLLQARRHTFHGRLIYAPAAAALVSGVRLEELGSPLAQWTPLPHAFASQQPDGSLVGEVVHVNRFGNLVTNIHASQLPPRPRIDVGNVMLDHLSDNYGEVPVGAVLAIVDSPGRLEISVNRGSAANTSFVSRETPVHVTAR